MKFAIVALLGALAYATEVDAEFYGYGRPSYGPSYGHRPSFSRGYGGYGPPEHARKPSYGRPSYGRPSYGGEHRPSYSPRPSYGGSYGLRDTKDLRNVQGIKDTRGLGGLSDTGNLRDTRDLRNVQGIRDTRGLGGLADTGNLRE